MCFDYVERFTLLLNDLDGSMKLPPGKYPPENCLGFLFYENPNNEHCPISPLPLAEIPSVIIALQQMKKQTLKSKVMKIKG